MANWVYLRVETKIETIKADRGQSEQMIFPVVDNSDTYQGYVTIKEINNSETGTAGSVLTALGEGAEERRNVFVFDSEPLDIAKRKLRERKLQLIPVLDSNRRYRGTIDKDSSS